MKEVAVDIAEALLSFQRAVSLKDKLWDRTSTSPAVLPVWTRGQKLSFKRSWSWSDASQITTSSSVIFPFTASLCSFLWPVLRCAGSLAGAPLSALTLCNQMWHTEGSGDSWEDKVTQSPTFNEGYAPLLLTGLHRLRTHTYALCTCVHLHSLSHTHAHTHACTHIRSNKAEQECFADRAFSRACAISEAITY